MRNLTYVSLTHIVGNTLATETTVNLFNSIRTVKTDKKGKYLEEAVKPHLMGVLTRKVYL
jgi:hypothetical protein